VTLDGAQSRMGLTAASGLSSISKHDADEMKLAITKAPEPFCTAMGVVTIRSFSLGSYEVGRVQLLVSSGPPTQNPNVPPYIGWFAVTSLVGVDFELDFAFANVLRDEGAHFVFHGGGCGAAGGGNRAVTRCYGWCCARWIITRPSASPFGPPLAMPAAFNADGRPR
jgi:hypothetical protein